jgi:hypothetical protein
MREIWLRRYRTKRGEFGLGKTGNKIAVRMWIGNAFEFGFFRAVWLFGSLTKRFQIFHLILVLQCRVAPMKSVITQGEYIIGLRLFHIQPLGSSLFCETHGNQAIKTGENALVK